MDPAEEPNNQQNATLTAKKMIPKGLYAGPSFLKSFTMFPKLPLEIRIIIWKLTLEPRDIELEFNQDRGFYSRIWTPAALRVCHDSRDAVQSLYPVCFGNVMFERRTVFNFSLDTLYLDTEFQVHIFPLLASMTPLELSKLQYLAVAADIDELDRIDQYVDLDTPALIKKAAAAMPALQELRVCYDAVWYPDGGPYEQGHGPSKIYNEYPAELKEFHMCDHEFSDWSSLDMEDIECDCMEFPNPIQLPWTIITSPKVFYAFSWRPT